ncbi:MAG: MFS transporter [Clostridiales bacterium]|nr:MFS transporter [Clostridiales bacterium]
MGIFANKNYDLFFFGRIVSCVGDAVFLFVLVWYILDTTGSAANTGLLMMLEMAPGIVLAAFAGVVLDRFNRKNILSAADLFRGLILLAMILVEVFGTMSLGVILLCTLFIGFCKAFDNPACTSLIPNIVDESLFQQAYSIDTMVNNASQIAGAIIGAVLYSAIGVIPALIVCCTAFFIASAAELFIRVNRQATAGSGVFNEIKEGFNYLLEQKSLLAMFMFFVVLNFFLAPMIYVYMPYIFNIILNATAEQLSFTRVAFGAGVVLGSLIVSLIKMGDRKSPVMMRGLFLFAFSILGFMVPVLPAVNFSLNASVVFYIANGLVTGLFFGIVSVSSTIIFQSNVIDDYRGRVTALLVAFGTGAMPLGYLIGGYLTDFLPMHIVLLATDAVLILVCVFMSFSKRIKVL